MYSYDVAEMAGAWFGVAIVAMIVTLVPGTVQGMTLLEPSGLAVGFAAAGKLEMRGRGIVMLGIGAWLFSRLLALFFPFFILVPSNSGLGDTGTYL